MVSTVLASAGHLTANAQHNPSIGHFVPNALPDPGTGHFVGNAEDRGLSWPRLVLPSRDAGERGRKEGGR
eukprot:1568060-Rhodomonas_salina.1